MQNAAGHLERRKYAGDGYRGVSLLPHRWEDIARIERAYWTCLARAKRSWAVFERTMAAIRDAGGVAYCKCYGNCAQPCFYRFVCEASAAYNGAPIAYLDDHVIPSNGEMRKFGGGLAPETQPIHVDLGEAHWAAMESMKSANGRWLAWKAAAIDIMSAKLPKVDAQRTARVQVNGRDWWFASSRGGGSRFEWRVIATPEEERVEMFL